MTLCCKISNKAKISREVAKNLHNEAERVCLLNDAAKKSELAEIR